MLFFVVTFVANLFLCDCVGSSVRKEGSRRPKDKDEVVIDLQSRFVCHGCRRPDGYGCFFDLICVHRRGQKK
jgi:hypothetical protein